MALKCLLHVSALQLLGRAGVQDGLPDLWAKMWHLGLCFCHSAALQMFYPVPWTRRPLGGQGLSQNPAAMAQAQDHGPQDTRNIYQGWGQRWGSRHCCSARIRRQPRGIPWGARAQPSWKPLVEGCQGTVWDRGGERGGTSNCEITSNTDLGGRGSQLERHSLPPGQLRVSFLPPAQLAWSRQRSLQNGPRHQRITRQVCDNTSLRHRHTGPCVCMQPCWV